MDNPRENQMRPTAVNQPTSRTLAAVRLATACTLVALLGLACYYCLNAELNADEGFYLLASRLVVDGFRPYRDFGYTQMPFLPYANLPGLQLFGFSLTGIRLTGLAWVAIAAVAGCAALRRRADWTTALVFAALLFASPGWLALSIKGKTYAFVGLCVLASSIALVSSGNARIRWMIFTLGAVAGVMTRLPTLPFFAVGWIFLFLEVNGWRTRLAGLAATSLFAGFCIYVGAAGTWDTFRFWVLDFHLASEMERPFASRITGAFFLAPAIWIGLLFSSVLAILGRSDTKCVISLAALWITIAASVLPITGYGEYVAPFVPVAAFVISRQLGPLVARTTPLLLGCVFCLCLSAGWLKPPPLDKDVLLDAGTAENFLRTILPADYSVVASMPEIPAATGHHVPLLLAPGKFSVTEDFQESRAESVNLATPEAIQRMIKNQKTGAVVFSPSWPWNFAWSVPSYHFISKEKKDSIFKEVVEDFELGFENQHYVIFIRKDIPKAE